MSTKATLRKGKGDRSLVIHVWEDGGLRARLTWHRRGGAMAATTVVSGEDAVVDEVRLWLAQRDSAT